MHQHVSTGRGRGCTVVRRAFTLVELLVVIGIIALLIGILLPTLSSARQAANSLVCMSNMRQFGMGQAFYINDNNGFLPIGTFDGVLNGWSGDVRDPEKGTDWTVLLANAMGQAGVNWEDQEASRNGTRGIFADLDTVEADGMTVTTADGAGGEAAFVHFSTHPRVMPNIDEWSGPDVGPTGWVTNLKPYKITQIPNATEIITIFDGAQIGENGFNASPQAYRLDADRFWYDHFMKQHLAEAAGIDMNSPVIVGNNTDAQTWGGGNGGNPRFRHKGNESGNFLFADGHVEPLRYLGPGDSGQGESQLLRRNIIVPAIDRPNQ